MHYEQFGLIENNTAMSDGFCAIKFSGPEKLVIGLMIQEGFDLTSCGVEEREEGTSLGDRFPVEDWELTPDQQVILDSINPQKVIDAIRGYALMCKDDQKEVSELANKMADELEAQYQKRLEKIDAFHRKHNKGKLDPANFKW